MVAWGVSVRAVAAVGAATLALAPSAQAASSQPPAGLPSGVPAAATRPEPTLPAPAGWPFPEAFPRTSGTGREDAGASYWSDFLYDDHGALGAPVTMSGPSNASSLAPVRGSYAYPPGPAHNNGADIFRTAVGLDGGATYWRVDWNTLADPTVPIAEWTFDTDANAATGASAWPAGAGVRSPGIERALVVTSRGAELLDAANGHVLAHFPTQVDRASRSFVVRIPRTALPVSGDWRIRLAAGLSDTAGTGFAPVPPSRGALAGQPAVYNVAFRDLEQEGPLVCPPGVSPPGPGHAPVGQCGNFWNENDQAQTLATGDVSTFSRLVRWSQLVARARTPEPLPRGYSVRWYASRLNVGQGVVANSSPQGDLRPNYLGRVQPYVVYVPTDYDPRKATPLTWVLHSLGANHNQYSGVAPSQLQEECQDRHSICATTLGFGPDGWYFDEAEVDFWQVWHALAATYRLDPEATVISGYSMGGWAAYKLGLAYPDLFAKALALEGPPRCGLRVVEGAGSPGGPGHCTTDGDSTPVLGNARSLPYVGTYGLIDELVPITSGLEQVDALDRLGYRYYFLLYPAEDHLVFALQNDFSPAIAQLGHPRRARNPGHITYGWYPNLTRPGFGIGPTGVYWIRGLRARTVKPGTIARLDARSGGIPDRPVTVHRSTSALAQFHPTPALVKQLTWRLGARPAPRRHLALRLSDVGSLGVDTVRARFSCGTLTARSDGPATVRLLRLAPGRAVTIGGRRVTTSSRAGVAAVPVARGATTAHVACARTARRRRGGSGPASGRRDLPSGGVEAGEGGTAVRVGP